MENKFRYKITLEYLGQGFCGWQKQEGAISVQQVLEEAIFKFTGEQVALVAAGRTDAGVNAYGQVAHFDLSREIDTYKAMGSINHFVWPHRVGVLSCRQVSEDFHARFSAIERQYVYKILNRKSTMIIDKGLKYWIRDQLNIEAMREGAGYLIGKHDFTSFRAAACQAKSPIKTLSKIEIVKTGEDVSIYVAAPSFMHNMVRNIVGSLILVGRGIWVPAKIKEVLHARSREAAGPTAPAEGLYFLEVKYPE
jgi:tRNA pseudouridine38-40 synthase